MALGKWGTFMEKHKVCDLFVHNVDGRNVVIANKQTKNWKRKKTRNNRTVNQPKNHFECVGNGVTFDSSDHIELKMATTWWAAKVALCLLVNVCVCICDKSSSIISFNLSGLCAWFFHKSVGTVPGNSIQLLNTAREIYCWAHHQPCDCVLCVSKLAMDTHIFLPTVHRARSTIIGRQMRRLRRVEAKDPYKNI